MKSITTLLVLSITSLCVLPKTLAQTPPLDGTFVGLDLYRVEQIESFVNEMAYVGMNTAVIWGVEKGINNLTITNQNDCTLSNLRKLEFRPHNDVYEKIRLFLTYAQQKNIDVYIGLINNHRQDSTFVCNVYKDPYKTVLAEKLSTLTRDLEQRYGSFPNFKGYTLVEEAHIPYWFYDHEKYYGSEGYLDYFIKTINALVSNKNPARKVILASLLDQVLVVNSTNPNASRNVQRAIAEFLYATNVDILLWQDLSGQTGNNIGFPQSTVPNIRDQYNALSSINIVIDTAQDDNPYNNYLNLPPKRITLTPENTWSIVEVFGCCEGDPRHPAQTLPAPISKIAKQIENAPRSAVGKRLTWIFHLFSTTPLGELPNWNVPERNRLADAFKAWYNISGSYLRPLSYTWTTENNSSLPSTEYPDTNNSELTDLWPGYIQSSRSIRSTAHPSWTGVRSKGTVEFTLSEKKRIDWVGGHFLYDLQSGIHLPQKMEISCFNTRWRTVYSGSPRFNTKAADQTVNKKVEYFFSNPKPIETICGKVKVSFEQPGWWLFIGEIEMVARAGFVPYDLNSDNDLTQSDVKIMMSNYGRYKSHEILKLIEAI